MSLSFKRIVAILLMLISTLTLFGCNITKDTLPPENDSGGIIVDDVEIKDSFIDLDINEFNIVGNSIQDIRIDDIKVNSIHIDQITLLDLEITSINDQFVYLAYQNFIDYYGVDFNLSQFIKDVAIGTGVILVVVTLSTVAGPLGTYFGAVIASELTLNAIVVAAAIDAAVSGYLAYRDGGDVSHILGHMLNGIADGYKWGAILAPITGAVAGIKALKAVKNLQSIPGFEQITHKQATEIFKNAAQIFETTSKLSEKASKEAISNIYDSVSKNLKDKITEEIFGKIVRNKTILTNIIKRFDPFDTAKEVLSALRKNFVNNSGVSDDITKEIIKKIQNKSIKSLDQIDDLIFKEYIDNNMTTFLELYGKKISKDLLESISSKKIGTEVLEQITRIIKSSDNIYGELVSSVGRETADNVLKHSENLLLLQMKFNSNNVQKLLNTQKLYDLILKNNVIEHIDIKNTMDMILSGTLKSTADLPKRLSQIGKNINTSSEIIIETLKSMKLDKKTSSLINDLITSRVLHHGRKDVINVNIIKDVLDNRLSKNQIVSKYGNRVYQEFLSKAQYNIPVIGLQSKLNKNLLDDLLSDYLSSKNVTTGVIDMIKKGAKISDWNIDETIILEIGNVVADYYKTTDSNKYLNYIIELSENRSKLAKEFNQLNNNTPVNAIFNAIQTPTGNNANYIKQKYGDILYNSAGYPIFDKYSIARLEILDLTGLDDGLDIARANFIHHGANYNIPGYTWHHIEDGKTLILIPTDLHEAYRHSGGASLLRDGAFE